MIGHAEEKNENKYLVLDYIFENKEVLEKYEEIWEDIKKEIENINGGKKKLNMEKILKQLDLSLMIICH